jgi:hypothetical protein
MTPVILFLMHSDHRCIVVHLRVISFVALCGLGTPLKAVAGGPAKGAVLMNAAATEQIR